MASDLGLVQSLFAEDGVSECDAKNPHVKEADLLLDKR